MPIPIADIIIRKMLHMRHANQLPYNGHGGSRLELAKLFSILEFNRGAEIGVRDGEYSEILLKANPQLKLMCIDNWAPYFEVPSARKQENYLAIAQTRLTQFAGAKIMRMNSMEAAKITPDKSLDFVYIDAAHDFDSVMLDIIHWTAKVRAGGIVSGHDFSHNQLFAVIPAVEGYARAHNLCWYLTRTDDIWLWVVPD